MRFVQIGFGILIVGGLTALGCGDDGTASTPPATGGTGGKGGTGGTGGTAGATGGTGGATGGTGGTAGAATGGSAGAATGGSAGVATGGTAGVATGGSAGTGGEAGGPPAEECPATQPTDGDPCDSDVNPGGGDACTYGTAPVTTCSCPGFGMMPTWNCQTLSCPATEPATGDMCDPDMHPGFGDDPCVFGVNECTCGGGGGMGAGGAGGMGEWECSAPPMCPATAPTDGDMCDTDTDPGAMDGGCVFDTMSCVCGGMGGGGGGMQTWNCGTCPATAPADEETCDSDVNGFCAYDTGNCTCGGMDEWNCP